MWIDLWFLKPKRAHAGAQGGRIHTQNEGGALGAVDAPVGFLKHPQDMFRFGLLQAFQRQDHPPEAV